MVIPKKPVTIRSNPPSSPVPESERWKVFGLCVLLTAAVLLVFGRASSYQFVNYDDDLYFYANTYVQDGLTWRSMTWAFTTGYNGNWHPLTWLSYMLDVELFGSGSSGPHLINILLHTATVILLFHILRHMTGALLASAFVAAVFAIHPLRVESVVWVSERKDVLSGLFFVLTLGAYLRYVRHPFSPVRYVAVGLFFALGLMSKPMLVTVPFVLLLLDWWPLGRLQPGTSRTVGLQRLVIEKIPFLLVSAIFCLVTVLVQPQGSVMIEKIPFDLRLYNAAVSYVIYLERMIHPVRLAVFYPYSANEMLTWKVGLSVVLLAGITAFFFVLRRKRPYLLVGWLWYLGMLLPVIGLMQVSRHARADRYTYLPQIGICLLVVWTVMDLSVSWRYRRQLHGSVAFIVIATLMVSAWIQTSHWRDSKALWTHTLASTSRNHVAHNNMGLALMFEGQSADSIGHFQKALEINPRYVEAHNNFGALLAGQGQFTEAVQHFQRAIEIQPNCPEAENGIGNVLTDRGKFTDAMLHYQRAIAARPNYWEAFFNLGNALALQGRYEEAVDQFRRALQFNPHNEKIHKSLDTALFLQSQPKEGVEK